MRRTRESERVWPSCDEIHAKLKPLFILMLTVVTRKTPLESSAESPDMYDGCEYLTPQRGNACSEEEKPVVALPVGQ